MKIFFCLKTFLPFEIAGTEIYVAELAKGLLAKGYEVAVVKPNYKSESFSQYVYEGIKVLEYPEEDIETKELITGRVLPKGLPRFVDILEKNKPDIIHFHEISGSNGITIQHYREAYKLHISIFTTFHLLRYVCKTSNLLYKNSSPCEGIIEVGACSKCLLYSRGLPSALADIVSYAGNTMKGVDLRKYKGRLPGLLSYPNYIQQHKNDLEEIFKLSKKVVVLNQWFEKILRKNELPHAKMIIIPQGIPDSAEADVADFIANNVSRTTKLVYVGRISEVKGLHMLLKVLNSLEEKNWSLDIYGKPTEEEYYAECLKLTEGVQRITWKGVIMPKEVVSTLRAYDLLLFPTAIEEMSPLIVLEAFRAGIPVLASDVNANREMITDGKNGWLYKKNNMSSLTEKLKGILHEPSVLILAKQNIPAVSSFEAVIEKHQILYSTQL
jgi:glycosyltransferase involved in cell wall biosynthesis